MKSMIAQLYSISSEAARTDFLQLSLQAPAEHSCNLSIIGVGSREEEERRHNQKGKGVSDWH